jgi:hypothetical protein
MDQEHQAEWDELEREARAWLEQPPELSGLRVEAHGVALPSFDDGVVVTLALPGPRSEEPPLGLRRVWRRTSDAEKFTNAIQRLKHGRHVEPTLEESEVELPQAAVDALVRRAAALIVPARVTDQLCLDGTTWILRLGGPFTNARFEWHDDPPLGWEALAEFARDLGAVVETELN